MLVEVAPTWWLSKSHIIWRLLKIYVRQYRIDFGLHAAQCVIDTKSLARYLTHTDRDKEFGIAFMSDLYTRIMYPKHSIIYIYFIHIIRDKDIELLNICFL